MQPEKMAGDSMPEVMQPKNLREWFSQFKYRLGETSLTFYGILGYLFLYTPIVIMILALPHSGADLAHIGMAK